MSFECEDLDRALEFPELMPDALAHAETCPQCREQIELWNQISRVAPELHEEWNSPGLWQRIHAEIAPPARRRPLATWRWALAAAAVIALAVVVLRPWSGQQVRSQDLLTEEALRDVQQSEAAYARSIEKLATLARPSLDQGATPLADAYREKLLVLDSAIADAKTHMENNRYNPYVQVQLASLYQEKQKTLEEWLKNAKHS